MIKISNIQYPKSYAPPFCLSGNNSVYKRQWYAYLLFWVLLWILLLSFPAAGESRNAPTDDFERVIKTFVAFGNRTTGTPGARSAAVYIKDRFSQLELESVGSQWFSVPVVRHGKSAFTVTEQNVTFPIRPIHANAITPQTVPPPGLEGPLVYVGPGDLRHFNGKIVDGAIILMELDSGKNWLHAANLGAKALIYLDRGVSSKALFEEKIELSPIQFPRFWMPISDVRKYLRPLESAPSGLVAPQVQLSSEARWQEVDGENVYGLIPGSDPQLKEQLIIVEAFYDSSAMVSGLSSGADEDAVGQLYWSLPLF